MLVSYRRVPKSLSVSPQMPSAAKPVAAAPDTASPRPILLKSASDDPRPTPFRAIQEGGDTDVEEAELPEVALDYNRHIIPHWLLHGNRNRSVSHSSASSSSCPRDPRLRRHHYNGMTAQALTLPRPRCALTSAQPLNAIPPADSPSLGQPKTSITARR